MVARRLHARRQFHAHDSGNPAARRLAACGVLCICMATLIIVLPWHSGGFNLLKLSASASFWLVKRQMPYDLIRPAPAAWRYRKTSDHWSGFGMLRSGPANDTANPATEQTTATAITAVKPRSGCCNSQPAIASMLRPVCRPWFQIRQARLVCCRVSCRRKPSRPAFNAGNGRPARIWQIRMAA